MKPLYAQIAESHKIESVKVLKNNIIINNGEAMYKFTNSKIAKAVALKLNYFLGI